MTAQKKSPVAKHITYDSLTRSVAPAELHAFRQQHLPKKTYIGRLITYWVVGVGLGGWALSLLIIAMVNGSAASAVGGMIPLVLAVVVLVIMVVTFRHADMNQLRFWGFATDNGWRYERSIPNIAHRGMIFQAGHSRKAEHVIYVPGGGDEAAFEIGAYQYTVGSGKNQHTYYWDYVSVELDRNVPHMVLDAKKNNVSFFGKSLMSNLPATFRRDQVLSLEGDFDKHFTLYAPEQYKRDAYYIFTPDLMALLIDNLHQFDAEVVDNKLFIYTRGTAKQLLDADFIYQLLMIIHTVGMKVHRQTDYYADDHVADRAANVVADSGRRLKHGVSWAAIIVTAIIILLNVVPMFFE